MVDPAVLQVTAVDPEEAVDPVALQVTAADPEEAVDPEAAPNLRNPLKTPFMKVAPVQLGESEVPQQTQVLGAQGPAHLEMVPLVILAG